MDNYDICALTGAITLFVGYHLHLYIVKPQLLGGQVPFAMNRVNADIWLLKHKEKAAESPQVLLAVQTLRTTVMAAVFVGGNAINIAYNLSNDYNDLKDERLKARSLIITALMFSSFLCWANVIRLASMVGYYIGTLQYAEKLRLEAQEREKHQTESVAAELEASSAAMQSDAFSGYNMLMSTVTDVTGSYTDDVKSKEHDFEFAADTIPDVLSESKVMMGMITVFFSFGFRLMFVSIPFAFYSAGPTSLIVTSVCMFMFLRMYDHVRHTNTAKMHKSA
jgi:hypothetical protein